MTLPEQITPVYPEDADRFVEAWEASVRATHHFVTEADIEVFRPLVRGAVFSPIHLACVRDTQGQIAGFVGVEGDKIEMLFIHPDWRGKGLGRRLILFAISELGSVLVDVNEQNEQAVGFYLHLGFEVFARSELDGTGKPYPLLHMRLSRLY